MTNETESADYNSSEPLMALEFVESQKKACSNGHCWPTLFLLGVQKAATTSLFDVLKTRHKICGAEETSLLKKCSDCNEKETHFFTQQTTHKGKKIHMSDSEFKALYPEHRLSKCGRFMEGTPSLQEPNLGREIANKLPTSIHSEVRMVLVLREPVSRDLSWFNHQLDNYHTEGGSFSKVFHHAPSYEEYAKKNLKQAKGCKHEFDDAKCAHMTGHVLAWGMYAPQIKSLLKHWERKHMFIVQMDHLLDKTHSTLEKLYKFAGFSGSAPSTLPKDNTHDGPWKISSMPCHIKKELKEFYAPYNKELYEMMRKENGPHSEPVFGVFDEEDVKCHD